MQDVSNSLSIVRSLVACGDGICTDALPPGLTLTLGTGARSQADNRDADERACCSQRARSSLRVAGLVSDFSHSNGAQPAISASIATVAEYRIMHAFYDFLRPMEGARHGQAS
jgi:hypothetical protein